MTEISLDDEIKKDKQKQKMDRAKNVPHPPPRDCSATSGPTPHPLGKSHSTAIREASTIGGEDATLRKSAGLRIDPSIRTGGRIGLGTGTTEMRMRVQRRGQNELKRRKRGRGSSGR